MRFISFQNSISTATGLAIRTGNGEYRGLIAGEPGYPRSLRELLRQGPPALQHAAAVLSRGPVLDLSGVRFLPPVHNPGKIICIGLNYVDHSTESGFKPPDYPAVFARFNSSLIGHLQPIVCPRVSEQLDFEGELVAIVGKAGRAIPRNRALEHIAGYSLFNDASIRDFQFKSTQWTVGKNFDATGAFGPDFVSADELPPGCRGLHFQTQLNAEVVQNGAIDDLIFDVATLVEILSQAVTLLPGDIIVTGTPAGVGLARKPPLWMKAGDICTVVCEQLGTLQNPIVDQA